MAKKVRRTKTNKKGTKTNKKMPKTKRHLLNLLPRKGDGVLGYALNLVPRALEFDKLKIVDTQLERQICPKCKSKNITRISSWSAITMGSDRFRCRKCKYLFLRN